jgi:NADH-quinone oxidoreductase subunit L
MWGVGILTSLLTATYMFRLVHLTFHGAPRFAAAGGPHSGDPHDAPEATHAHPPSPASDFDASFGETSPKLPAATAAVHGHDAAPAAYGQGPAAVHGRAPAHGHGHGHGGGLPHDAPPAMAIALVVLALGSVVAGYVGLPHVMGHNILAEWLDPVFEAPHAPASGLVTFGDCAPGGAPATAAETGAAADGLATLGDCAPASDIALASLRGQPQAEPQDLAHAQPATEGHGSAALEWTLMGVSTLIAFLGIGMATFIWLQRPEIADRVAARMPGVYGLLLNKYYIDELYHAAVVHPVKVVSEDGLWRGMDARVVDGAVNATGQIVGAMSAVLRLLQTGSVKTYAASTFVGVVLILAYYIWR